MKRSLSGKGRVLAGLVAALVLVVGGFVATQKASAVLSGSGVLRAGIQELDGSIDFPGNGTAYKTTTHDVGIEPSAPYDWSSLFTGCTTAACASGNGVPSDNGPITTNGAVCQVGSCTGLVEDAGVPYTGDLFTKGSKDTLDVSKWSCAQQSNPPKDELVNTYAAAWHAPTQPAGSAVSTGDTVAFVGLERPNTNGDSNAGVWLFKQSVTCQANGTFSGGHSNGDVFLVGSFLSGGSNAVLNQYTWTCAPTSLTNPACANANGALVLSHTGSLNCPDDASTTTFCQVTNQQIVNGTTSSWTVHTPWSNIDTGTGGIPGPGFLEIGIDLSALTIGAATGACFSSFLADTRSSGSSTQAETKDFINGNFPTCGNLSVQKYIDKDLDPNLAGGDIANGPDASDTSSNIPGFPVTVTNTDTSTQLCAATTSTSDGTLPCGTGLNNVPSGAHLGVTETVPAATPGTSTTPPPVSPNPLNPTPTYFNTDPGVVGAGDVSGLQGTSVTKSITMGGSNQTVYIGNECFVNFEFHISGAPTGAETPQGITVSYTVNSGNRNGTAPGGVAATPNMGSISLAQAASGSATWTGTVTNYFVQNDNITWTWKVTDFSGTTSGVQTGDTVALSSGDGYPSCFGTDGVAFNSPVLGGIKFKDANHDGTQDSYTALDGTTLVPEPLLGGFTMNLYTGNNCGATSGSLVTTAQSQSSDVVIGGKDTGFNYTFGQPGPGTYSVSEAPFNATPPPVQWIQTAPLVSGNVQTCVPFTATLGDNEDGPAAIGNTPLSDLTVTVSGETGSTASNVSCTGTGAAAATTSSPGSVNTNTSTGLETGTYVCTVKIIDP